MSMKQDPIDLLLQLAFLEGEITTHGLYEKLAAERRLPHRSLDRAKLALLQQLEAALARTSVRDLSPLTVGAYLCRMREERSLRPQEVSSRIGIPSNIYKMLEHDRISPLKISIEAWRKLRQLFQTPRDALETMIRRTHQLVFFQASFRTTLARYDARKKSEKKAATLRKATEELFARAALSLPPREQKKLDALLKALEEESEGL
jgi:hypothetical protein